ncbi:hypothetical protein LOC68_27550 [Blastopirellula sp. JC732]|uniref:Uncharacterized protein n=1 Tax=Blastopirellula sediminis TaxID=2894196 RepID=A0A9X1MRQ9_9BACT|nr:hypothetical protein [Blastopirellula sediminis]MCC9604533.1 hypothetical protein [Blastopirellula sediminis]MCC9632168.1 hypothetical protein [Blastopirellula sediminis]
MSTRPENCCCSQSAAPEKTSWRSRIFEAIAWIVPGTLLALMPKCPVCVAAYLALLTGVGVPLSTAGYLRTGLIAVCTLSLVYLAVRRLPTWAGRFAAFATSRT